jgi:hypothetical protein
VGGGFPSILFPPVVVVVGILSTVVVVVVVAMMMMMMMLAAKSTTRGGGGGDIIARYHYGPACVPAPIEQRAAPMPGEPGAAGPLRGGGGGRPPPAVACGGGGGGGGGDGAALADVVLRAPRRMSDGSPHNTARPVYFVHVGKTGGTSVDDLMTRILKCEGRAYVGNAHYDWSFVRHRERLRRRTHAIGDADDDEYREAFHPRDGGDDDGVASGADVITFLRHPVSRAHSQFEYSKSLPWARESNASFLHQTFDEYLDDPSRTWTQPIADGESGSDFLAGIFPPEDDGGWVLTDGKRTAAKARLRANRTAAALLAARNLEKTAWFGLLEDVGRSMEMLGATLGLGYVPVFPMTNSAHHHHHHHHNGQHLRQSSMDIEEREARIGEGGGDGGGAPYGVDTIEKIARYVPKDLWLYEYATRLFEARYSYLVGGGGCADVPPALPPLPDFR